MELDPAAQFSSAEAQAQLGLERLHQGDAAMAAEAFAAAIAADPNHAEARHGLVRALGDAGQLQASVTAAQALTQLTPDDPLAFAALSIALQRAGEIAAAETAAGRARILEWKHQLAAGPAD